MAYSIKPGLRCFVCKHAQTTYQRNPSRYAGKWRKYKTTRSLHFGKPVLCVGNTYYFVEGAWMMRISLKTYHSEHNAHEGVSRLPEIKVKPVSDFRPKQRIRRDSEKITGCAEEGKEL